MSTPYLEQLQDLVAEEVADSLMLLDLHPGISEETRLNLAVDLATASGYTMALGDAIDLLRASGHPQAAELIRLDLLPKVTSEEGSA